jgi:molybdopterin-guanine dinucleotide biosynthesis protein A
MIAAAILAGGQATRFGGRDKSTLPVGGRPIIDRLLAVTRQAADSVFIVAADAGRAPARAVPVVTDAWPDGGALGGLYTALLRSPAEQTLVLAGDLPFVTVAFLRHLADSGRDVDLAIARTARGYEPLCASYPRTCVEPIRRLLEAGRRTVADVVTTGVRLREIGPDELAPFDPDLLFFNVNTPDDYARAVELAARID